MPPRAALFRFLVFLVALGGCGASPAAPDTRTPTPDLGARDATAAAAPALAPGDIERGPFLWEVRGRGGVSHVFGTIHLGVSFDELPAVVRERLDASHTLVVEADSGDEVMAGSMDLLMLPAGQSLRAMLGETYWAKLIEHLGATMPAAVLDRFQPWLPTVLLSLDDADGMADATGMDAEIEARARSRGARVIYLETASEQAELLARSLGIDDLQSTLDDVPAARMSMKAMIRAYRAGNFAAMTGLVFQPDEVARDPEQYELMFHVRNRNWMKTLTPLLEQGGVFVAVGAGHFAGDQGLLALLRQAGFEVTRARCTAAAC